MSGSRRDVSGHRHGRLEPEPGAAYPEVTHEETSGRDMQAESSRDRDIRWAKQLVETAPDIREDRVAATRRAVQHGRLNLRGTDLADRLLQDELHHADLDE